VEIPIYGIGYVGAVTAACIVRGGHSVVAVDPNPVKVALLTDGKVPIFDANVSYSCLTGANLSFIRQHISHLEESCWSKTSTRW